MKKTIRGMLFLIGFVSFYSMAQTTVSGTIIDASTGVPIPGVNVLVEGTSNGSVSDFDGLYAIQDVKDGDTLLFSYVGFKTQRIKFENQSQIDVVMEEDAATLDQVVVVGYGTSRKKDLTGSVSLITADDFNTGANVTAENLFTGRVAGVNVNTAGGPAGNSEIRIRGGASLNASNNPLIVIDGLPLYEDPDLAKGSRSILSTINPNDIASFSVLKDASAAAIYGNRGANGVIIITTKRGKQKLQVTLDAQTSVNVIDNTIDVFSADEYRNYVTENFPEELDRLGNANTDWQDAIYRDAFSSLFNATISGSIHKNLPARLSINRTDQEGLRLTSNFERTTSSLALNPNLLDGDLKIDLNANVAFEKNRFADGVEKAAVQFDPTRPILDPNSSYGGYFEYTNDDGVVLANVPFNPVSQLLNTRNQAEVLRYYGNFKVDYRLPFLKDANFVVNLGLDNSTTNRFLERPSFSVLGPRATTGDQFGERSDTDLTTSNQLLDTYLNYQKKFGEFNVQATGGYSYQSFKFEKFETGNVLDTVPRTPEKTIQPDIVLIAYFLRSNLSFKDKYFLKGSIRRDGTSRFGGDNRWGYFPALSAGWQISEENFLKESKIVSNLKLRLGYGITGQQEISAAYDYLERYRLSNNINSRYVINGVAINAAQAQFRNENLKWEEITEYNIGFDYGFFSDRIAGSVDVFRKVSDDLLSFSQVADGANFSNRGFQNIGKFSTEGIEFSVAADIIQTEDVQWNVSYNTTFIDRKIEKLALDQDIFEGGIDGGTGNQILIRRTGFAPDGFYTFAQLYDIDGRPIEGAYADLNGDGQITIEDRYISGNGTPDVTMGFQSSLNFKGFDFNFNLRASFGNEIYNNINSAFAQQGNLFRVVPNNVPTSILDTNFERTPDVIFSDFYVEDASFLRMDNITLGYTIKDIMKGVSSLRVWAGVQNAFVITDYSGIDPEITNGGVDQSIFPRGKTYLMGVNYKF